MMKRILIAFMCMALIGVNTFSVVMAEENDQEIEYSDSHEDESEDNDSSEDSDSEYDSDYVDDIEADNGASYDEGQDMTEYDYSEPEYQDVDVDDVVYDEPVTESEELESSSEEELIPDIDEAFVEEEYSDGGLLDPFSLQDEIVPPSMSDDSWQGYPLSYHYNWDNSQNCWQWGEYYNGVCYKTPEGTYDANVRHAMGLYCDGQNIHLYIKYARIYGTKVNGDQFIFSVDGQSASYQFTFDDNGAPITGCNRAPGVYSLDLRNADGSVSGKSTGFVGNLTVHENNENDELELIIPLELLRYQNPSINLDTYSSISFFNPNLMYQSQACAGAGNGKAPFVLGSIALFAGSLFVRRKLLFF